MQARFKAQRRHWGAIVTFGFVLGLGGCDDGWGNHYYPINPQGTSQPGTGLTTLSIDSTSAMTAPSETPTFGGMTFGAVGTYDKLRGTASGLIDPRDPRNGVITDLNLAPAKANGLVPYNMDFYILKPTDLSKGNHKIFFEFGVGVVAQSALGWPTIPGVLYTGLVTVRNLFNWGPQFSQGVLSVLPPQATGNVYPSFVSKVDVDGNEIAGIRLPPVAAPVATTTGWNLRAAAYGGPDGCESTGSLIPFAPDQATRTAIGDPRLSLTERYGTHAGYVAAVTAAANALAAERLLLPVDVQNYIDNAQLPIEVIGNPIYGTYAW